jgi:hypothetical protein
VLGYRATAGTPGVAGSLKVTWPDAGKSRHVRAAASLVVRHAIGTPPEGENPDRPRRELEGRPKCGLSG